MLKSRAHSQVEEFHKKFGLPVLPRPIIPRPERIKLRIKLIREEFEEFIEAAEHAFTDEDLALIGKELSDLLYVTYGAAIEFGLPLDDIVDETHRSNLSKLWPDGSIRKREDGKILKPPTYSQAEIMPIIRKYQTESPQTELRFDEAEEDTLS